MCCNVYWLRIFTLYKYEFSHEYNECLKFQFLPDTEGTVASTYTKLAKLCKQSYHEPLFFVECERRSFTFIITCINPDYGK
jgi:hypothetical protein